MEEAEKAIKIEEVDPILLNKGHMNLVNNSSLNDFLFLKRIGEGAYSSVWKVKRKYNPLRQGRWQGICSEENKDR